MAPHTVAGRVATIIYAIIGIPIYVMIIHKLGRLCLKLLHKFWKFALRLTRYWRCARKSRKSKRQSASAEDDEESVNNIPVSLAVGVTFAWMLTCAGVCCLFFERSWDYFTSFYFFFISLTTIGFGKCVYGGYQTAQGGYAYSATSSISDRIYWKGIYK